jgi:hypothetical protein
MAKKDIFFYLEAITYSKPDLDFLDDEISSGYKQYSINQWLSMIEIYLPMMCKISAITTMDNESHYNMLKDIIPKHDVGHIRYIGKSKNRRSDKELRYIATYFQVGMTEALEYSSRMDSKIIEEIIEMYTYGRNNSVVV